MHCIHITRYDDDSIGHYGDEFCVRKIQVSFKNVYGQIIKNNIDIFPDDKDWYIKLFEPLSAFITDIQWTESWKVIDKQGVKLVDPTVGN